jgi:metal-responsive CopG/Arc/MetJ family transcriptional regulator
VLKIVAKKNGSKLDGTAKDYMLRVRMDAETVQQLDECCKHENAGRSEIVRDLIREKYAKIKK